jgi:hypothetical protein
MRSINLSASTRVILLMAIDRSDSVHLNRFLRTDNSSKHRIEILNLTPKAEDNFKVVLGVRKPS